MSDPAAETVVETPKTSEKPVPVIQQGRKRQETEMLIEFVRQNPFLFDKSNESYKDRDLATSTWDEIGKKLNISGQEAKSRWKNVYDAYRRHNMKQFKPSGSGGGASGEKPYAFAKQLQFLNKNLKDRNRTSNMSEEAGDTTADSVDSQDDDDGGQNTEETTAQETEENNGEELVKQTNPTSKRRRRNSKKTEPVEDPVSTELLQFLKENQAKIDRQREAATAGEHAYCNALAIELEQLDPEPRAWAKMNIQSIMYHAKLRSTPEGPSTSESVQWLAQSQQ